MRKKVYTVIRTPELEAIVQKTKKWLGEKTDSKTIDWLVKWGGGRLWK